MPNFEELYEKHNAAVYKTCLTLFNDADFADEITQEAFSRAFIKLKSLRDENSFPSWVITIAKHYGYNKARLDQYRFNKLPPDDLLEQGWDLLGPDNTRVEDINYIRRWILSLNDNDQQLVLLKYYHELSDAEIGEETGKTASAIKRRLALLRSKLKEAVRAKSE